LPYLVRLVVTARNHRKPFALQAASSQWVAPWPLRPLVALWWMAHFAIGILGAVATWRIVAQHDPAIDIGLALLSLGVLRV
jgi:hypothetical protein